VQFAKVMTGRIAFFHEESQLEAVVVIAKRVERALKLRGRVEKMSGKR
jgi:hypothetical protein